MPRTRSLAWSELKIGFLALAAIVLAVFLVFLVGGQGGLFAREYHLKSRYTNVMGLKEGGLVRLGGVEVGQIERIEFAGAEIEVTMTLQQAMQDKVTTGSRAAIGSLSLLGEGVVDITASTSGEPLSEWSYIPTARQAPPLGDVAAGASEGLEELTTILRGVRQGEGTMGKLFTDEAVYRELSGLLETADRVVASVNRGRGTLGQLVNDPAAYKALRASLEDLQAATRRINAGQGSLGRLLHDDAFARSLTATTKNLDEVTARISRGEGTAGKLVTDDALYKRLAAVSQGLERLVARLEAGEGTAGRLLHDRQLYENMDGAVRELRGLLADIRSDPRKFLNVRVSIF
ncbi:MAG: MCE family protein [Luteitalea sp.]|nr:MCE family protein [Luteitalea sp.]